MTRIAVVGTDNPIGKTIAAAVADCGWAELVSISSRSLLTDPKGGTSSGQSSTIAQLISECDGVVIYLVGSPAGIVAMTTATIDVIRRAPRPIRVVNVSSMSVYGSADGIVDEKRQLEGRLSEYAVARVEAERAAGAYPHVVTLRSGCEYGPGCWHWSDRVAYWLLARRLGDLGQYGDGYCNLTHIDDLCRAVLQALRIPDLDGQIFNIAARSPPTWNEYFTSFALALGAVPVRRVTRRRLTFETKGLAVPLKIAEIACRQLRLPKNWPPPAIPPSLLDLFRHEIILDVSRAENVLGLRWTSLADGLESSAANLRNK